MTSSKAWHAARNLRARFALDLATARLAQSAERKALNLVVAGSSPTVGVAFPAPQFARARADRPQLDPTTARRKQRRPSTIHDREAAAQTFSLLWDSNPRPPAY